MLFKIDDIVKVKEGLVEGRHGDIPNQVYFNPEMSKYCGMEAYIVAIHDNKYELDIDDGDWHWTDALVESL
jgi:hypothetical protein